MSRLNDGEVASRDRIMLIPRKAAPNEALIMMKRGRGKPALVAKNIPNIKHGQPHILAKVQ